MNPDGGAAQAEHDPAAISNPNIDTNRTQSDVEIDSAAALQRYLDRIPASSIPGVKDSPVLELKTGDTVRDAVGIMYEKNVSGALIADSSGDGFSDRFIGFIGLSSLLLWCLEEIGKWENDIKCIESEEPNEGACDILGLLERNSHIGQTKIGELGKSFLWDPYFPVGLEDTLFHDLLLLSKHRLQVLPVVELSNSHVTGFITQNAVIRLLLKSSGLEWFDSIADKVISDFRFDNEENDLHVYEDQHILEAFHVLWEKRMDAVAVIDRESKSLIGSLKNSDVHLLLEKKGLFQDRKRLTVKEFIFMESKKADTNLNVEGDQRTPFLMNCSLPNMHIPIANKRVNTLKQVMKIMAEKNSSFGFLVDDSLQVTGILTVRDIITQFAPPCMDSTIQGGRFFESALEQTGCSVKNGSIICNK